MRARSSNIGTSGYSGSSLEHRGFLQPSKSVRPFAGTERFAAIGGQATVDRLVDDLYDRFEADEILRPLFGRDLTDDRTHQKQFFAEWLGGPRRYSDATYAGLVHRHEKIPIDRAVAGRWLGHFRKALERTVAAQGDRDAIFEQVRDLAFALVNREKPVAQPRREPCSSHDALHSAIALARQGNLAALRAVLKASEVVLAQPSQSARVVHAAVWAGRIDVVRWLLAQGVDANRPTYLEVGEVGLAFERILFVTPLCAARLKKRAAMATLLIDAGAKDDIFTAAFLGHTDSIESWLAAEPTLAQAPDPAVDVLDVTPVDHAVAGGNVDALRILLEQGGTPLRGARSLCGAAETNNVEMVAMLLAHGADAKVVGVGRWVLHPEIALLRARAGASIDRSGAWIGHACTGNQGRKDDPDYVRALLRHGARADDRRNDGVARPPSSSHISSLDAAALHFAAKAGFAQTVQVLLEHGADPDARDAHGQTPHDWLERAAKSVAKEPVRRLLDEARGKRG